MLFGGGEHIRATYGEGYAFIYTPGRKRLTVDLSKLKGREFEARWFDVRDGRSQSAGRYQQGQLEFIPPEGGPDWVLVLDDTTKKYAPPGEQSR